MHLELWHADVMASVLVPAFVIFIFSAIRSSLEIDGDNGTDFLLVILSFDIALALGLLHGLKSLTFIPFGLSPEVAGSVAALISFILAIVSIWMHRVTQPFLSKPPGSMVDHFRKGGLRFANYVPSISAYSLHLAPFASWGAV